MSKETKPLEIGDRTAEIVTLTTKASPSAPVSILLMGSADSFGWNQRSKSGKSPEILDWSAEFDKDQELLQALLTGLDISIPPAIFHHYSKYTSPKAVQDYSPYQVSDIILRLPGLPRFSYLRMHTFLDKFARQQNIALSFGRDLEPYVTNLLKETVKNIFLFRFRE